MGSTIDINVEAPHKLTIYYNSISGFDFPSNIKITGEVEFKPFGWSDMYTSNPMQPQDDSQVHSFCNSNLYKANENANSIKPNNPKDNPESRVGDHLLGDEIILYPNPSGGQVFLDFGAIFDGNETLFVKLYNSMGFIERNFKFNSQLGALNLENLEPGIYFLKIFRNESLIGNKKLIIN
jgi:Secretion system C-terminal sorting domain